MMPDLAGFLVVAMIAYLIPGPDFFIILHSTASSKRAGLWTAMGAQSGLAVHLLLAVLGLSALAARSAAVFSGIKIAGAVYLIWLGVRILWPRTRRSARQDSYARKSASYTRARDGYLRGLVNNILNPKAVLFFLSILPQFIDASASATGQIFLLGAVDIVVGVLWWFVVVLLMSQFAGFLERPAVRKWWDRGVGSLLTGAGGVLAYSAATSKGI